MAPLITSESYQDIRQLIDPALTVDDLSDEMIEGQFYLVSAEAEVARLLPNSTSDRAKRAVALLTAAALAPLYPLPQKATLEDFSYTIPLDTVTGVAAELRRRAMAEINAERNIDSLTATRPTFFRVKKQSRYAEY
jgi:hypothetical protein